MNNAGFYKKDETQVSYAPNIVEGPNYLLVAEDKDSYSYPVDGWVWANSFDDAIAYFASDTNNLIAPFDVQPENYKLSADRSSQTEFAKLVTLLNLSLQQNKISETSEITIWDDNNLPRSITVDRFFKIIADYGMYCYSQRSN